MHANRIFLCLISLTLLFSSCSCHVSASGTTSTQSHAFIDELTFLGDSTTAHMQQRSALRTEQIWATQARYLNLDPRITYARIVAPDTGCEETIAEVAARLKPKYLVITLGIDYGVYYYRDRPDLLCFYYEKLLDAVKAASPNTVIVMQSIFPVARGCTAITNEMIGRANTALASLAAARGIFFADQTATLADEAGYLRPEYCYSADGIHLTAKAYEAILSHLKALESEIKKQ